MVTIACTLVNVSYKYFVSVLIIAICMARRIGFGIKVKSIELIIIIVASNLMLQLK